MATVRFADTSRFPSETIDGETVLIDSARGYLFLFTGVAPHIWHAFTMGSTVEAVVADVALRYGDCARGPTRAFIEVLEHAEMLVDQRRVGVADDPPPGDWPATFLAPSMERFEDVADIIAMDPIHEVDHAQGWPRRQ